MFSRVSNLKNIWQTVIGLEIHAQINSKTKLFSVAEYNFNSPTNSKVAFFDMATPGTLPIINGRCVELAIAAALCLKCQIDPRSEFDRKHYFYSDMPAGYQITQYRHPIAKNGTLKFMWTDDNTNVSRDNLKESEIRIIQVHIEQDSGKSLHDYGRNVSLVDLNRAGVGLLEIVTDSQFKCQFEAAGFVKELKDLLVDLGVCTGHMEQGALRVDANVSVKPRESNELGVRTEIKNIGSIRGVLKAIEFESRRQIEVLESGGTIVNETRFYNPDTESTFSMRDKEILQDYRYYPEPNLSPLQLEDKCRYQNGGCAHKYVCIECARKRLQNYSYPFDKRQLLISKFALPLPYANTILNEPDLYPWLLSVAKFAATDCPDNWFKLLGHFTVTLLLGELRARSQTASSCPLRPHQFADFVTSCCNKLTTHVKFHDVLKTMFNFSDKSAESIIKENKWDMISDTSSIDHLVRDFMKRHPTALKDHKAGKKRVDKFFKKGIIAENNNLLDKRVLSDTVDRILKE